jgi:hypothetical protein
LEKENIIISIIIVLCIAAAVAAYGITNSDSPIFSDLSSMSASDKNPGSGVGNITSTHNGSGSSVASTHGSSSGSGSSSSGSDSGTGTSDSGTGTSDSGSGSSNSGSNDNGGNSPNQESTTSLSYSDAQSIADSSVSQDGCYAGNVYYSEGYWYATIYDENGTAVDSIGIEDASGGVNRM